MAQDSRPPTTTPTNSGPTPPTPPDTATMPGFKAPTRAPRSRSRTTPATATTADAQAPPPNPSPPPEAPPRGLRGRLRAAGRPPAEQLAALSPGTSFRASSGDVRSLASLLAMFVVVATRGVDAAGRLVASRRGRPPRDLAATRGEARAIAQPLARYAGRHLELTGDVRSAADLTEALFALAHYAERCAGLTVRDEDLARASADFAALHPDAEASEAPGAGPSRTTAEGAQAPPPPAGGPLPPFGMPPPGRPGAASPAAPAQP